MFHLLRSLILILAIAACALGTPCVVEATVTYTLTNSRTYNGYQTVVDDPLIIGSYDEDFIISGWFKTADFLPDHTNNNDILTIYANDVIDFSFTDGRYVFDPTTSETFQIDFRGVGVEENLMPSMWNLWAILLDELPGHISVADLGNIDETAIGFYAAMSIQSQSRWNRAERAYAMNGTYYKPFGEEFTEHEYMFSAGEECIGCWPRDGII
ncbi:MAG: hypothetical protein DRJ13_10235, partial [Bacteroidetes bacterium]